MLARKAFLLKANLWTALLVFSAHTSLPVHLEKGALCLLDLSAHIIRSSI